MEIRQIVLVCGLRVGNLGIQSYRGGHKRMDWMRKIRF